MAPFWALRIYSHNEKVETRLEKMQISDLTNGEVVVDVHYSSINYKDALAGTGKGKILKRFPLNGGIDAAGVVCESTDLRFSPGQAVVITGCGLSEEFDGGYAEKMRVRGDSVVPLPPGLTPREAMILGTAGFTAALTLHRMEHNGQSPELGPILVTGASGGVGGFAVQLFAQADYEVWAVSGKNAAKTQLQKFGAAKVLTPEELKLGTRPLEGVRFGGAVDNVGGELLSRILAHVQLWGNVGSIGLAQSAELHATVMPFILRGVSLLGISSNNCTRDLRHELWRKLAGPWKPKHLEAMVARTVSLKELMPAFDDLLNRRVTGRILVEVQS